MNNLKVSQNGLHILEQLEGERLTAYKDSAGVPTIGTGHTGKDVYLGEVITQAENDELLNRDTQRFDVYINHRILRTLTQNQFDALLCFTYNVGFISDNLKILVENDDTTAVVAKMKEYHFITINNVKESCQGLINRRIIETNLYCKN